MPRRVVGPFRSARVVLALSLGAAGAALVSAWCLGAFSGLGGAAGAGTPLDPANAAVEGAVLRPSGFGPGAAAPQGLATPESGGRRDAELAASPGTSGAGGWSGASGPGGSQTGSVELRLAPPWTALSPIAVRLRRDSNGEERVVSLRDPRRVGGLARGSWTVGVAEPAWLGEPASITVPEDDSVALPFEPLGPWRGRIVDADDGSPLDAAMIVLEARGRLGDRPFEGVLGRRELQLVDGEFALGAGPVPAGEVRMGFEHADFETSWTPWIPWDGATPVDLGDVGLLRRGSRRGLAGRVIDGTSGAPLAGVSVIAVDPATRPEELWIHGPAIQGAAPIAGRVASSDASGAFVLGDLGVASVRVAAFRDSHGLSLSEPVQGDATVELALARRGVLRGRVIVDEEVRAAGVLAGVAVSGDGPSAVLALDDDLSFELGGLAPGRWRVALQAEERQAGGDVLLSDVLVEHALVRDGETTEVELVYPPASEGPPLAGRVLLPEGVEFSMLRAALWCHGEERPGRFAPLDAEGRFELRGPIPETGRVYVGGASRDGSRGFVTGLAWDPSHPVSASLEFDVRVAGVRGELWRDGAPAARASLLLACLDGDPDWSFALAEGLSITTDEGGRFEVFGLRPGRYQVGRVGGERREIVVGAGEPTPWLRLE